MNAASVNKVSELNSYLKQNPPQISERAVAENLRTVASTFVQAQQRRIDADYNLMKDIDETAVLTQLETVAVAFKSWNAIRDEPTAQAYLLSMLGNKDRREKKPSAPQQKKGRKNRQTHPLGHHRYSPDSRQRASRSGIYDILST